MAKSWSSRHDGGLIDRHCIFGVIGNNGMAGLMVRSNGFILLVYFNAPPLRTWPETDKQTKKRLNLSVDAFLPSPDQPHVM